MTTHDDTPATTATVTRVYQYGLCPPTQGAARIADQMHAAHRYQHTLVEIERTRRADVRAVLGAHASVAEHETTVQARVTDLATARAAIGATRSATRRTAIPPERKAEVERIRLALREARAARTAAKQALRDDPAIATAIAAANASAKARHKAARAGCGVYWGTYLVVEQAMDAARKSPADPMCRRWTGAGCVAAQIQHGITVETAEAETDTRFQLALTPTPVPPRSGAPGRRVKRRPRVRLRIGSTDDRAPIWGEWPLVYHRPLPAGAVIKAAQVHRRLVASREVWTLCLTITLPAPVPVAVAPDGGRVLAVDLGWARRDPNELRAANWQDSDGVTGEIRLDATWRATMRKVEDLRSIRDRRQHDLHAALIAWRAAQETLSAAATEALAHLPQWKSPTRFVRLARWWREHRQPSDDAIIETLEAWRRQDKHLWWWEAHARRRALLRRREQYRTIAARLAAQCDVLVIERLNLSALARIPAPEAERESHPIARSQRQETAPGELRAALHHAFVARGRRVVTVAAQGPASALLAAYSERQGVDDTPEVARVSRFKRLRGPTADQARQDDSAGAPLA